MKTRANLGRAISKKQDTFAGPFLHDIMTNTYLVDVIKALNPKERGEIESFLAFSSLKKAGNWKEMTTLYQIILDTAPAFSDEKLEKNRVYQLVFPDQAVVQGKLDKLMADLNKVVRSFILTQKYLREENEVRQQVDWAAWLRDHGMLDRARQITSKLEVNAKQDSLESLGQYRNYLMIAEENHEQDSIQNQVRGDLSIPKVMHSLDLYYYNYRAELRNRYLLQQKVTHLPDLDIADLGLDFYLEESRLLQISKKIHDVFEKDVPKIEEVKDLMLALQSQSGSFPDQTMAQFYAFLRSACALLLNSGHSEFLEILHQIHKDNLGRSYFFIHGEIAPNVYLNIVQVAIRAKDIHWAKEFTEKYKTKIIGSANDPFFYQFNMARCHFAEGAFGAALDVLPEVGSNSHYHHTVRRMELKAYYELDSDLLLYKIDAFRKFIERTAPKTLSTNLRTMDINFLKILIQLSQSPPKDKTRSTKLVERIKGKKLLAERDWLLEKAKALA